LSHSTSPFFMMGFRDRVSWTVILLISASWVPRFTAWATSAWWGHFFYFLTEWLNLGRSTMSISITISSVWKVLQLFNQDVMQK
jgi:hypothetical protein